MPLRPMFAGDLHLVELLKINASSVALLFLRRSACITAIALAEIVANCD